MSWINGIRGLVSSDELAKDVTGAEALLERHQVHKMCCGQITLVTSHVSAPHWSAAITDFIRRGEVEKVLQMNVRAGQRQKCQPPQAAPWLLQSLLVPGHAIQDSSLQSWGVEGQSNRESQECSPVATPWLSSRVFWVVMLQEWEPKF